MLYHEYYKGRLIKPPFPNTVVLATMIPFSLVNENDYEVVSGFKGSNAPIYLSFLDHFVLLSRIVHCALENISNLNTILIKMMMPSGARLTPTLLSDAVLLCQDILPELNSYLHKNVTVLGVEDSFRRQPQEAGNNFIELNLFSLSYIHEGFKKIITTLEDLGLRDESLF